MAKREKFTTYINCPDRGKSGDAYWEENENPVYKGPERELIKVSEGFEVINNHKIKCSKCGRLI